MRRTSRGAFVDYADGTSLPCGEQDENGDRVVCDDCSPPAEGRQREPESTEHELNLLRLRVRDADRLAKAVAALIRAGKLDARSPAGDALLDYDETFCRMDAPAPEERPVTEELATMAQRDLLPCALHRAYVATCAACQVSNGQVPTPVRAPTLARERETPHRCRACEEAADFLMRFHSFFDWATGWLDRERWNGIQIDRALRTEYEEMQARLTTLTRKRDESTKARDAAMRALQILASPTHLHDHATPAQELESRIAFAELIHRAVFAEVSRSTPTPKEP